MIETIIKNTKIYEQKNKKENRKKRGSFLLLSDSIVEFMALRAGCAASHLSILELKKY